MGIVFAGNQRVGIPTHLVGNVRMQIEARTDDHLVAETVPETLKKLALRVAALVGDHGTVKIKQDHVRGG